MRDTARRPVVTGIGIIAPGGIGKDAYWDAIRAGRCAIGRISRFDPASYATQLAGEVHDFNAADHVDSRLAVQTDRFTWMALAATEMALADSGLDTATVDPYRLSVITASATGGNEFGQREIQALYAKGPLFVGAYQSIAWFYAATTGQLSIRHGAKGPCDVIVTEGASGLDVLARAMRSTTRRGVEAALCGASEAPITPYALVCQMQSGRLSGRRDAATAYRPFDEDANGYVPGEGSAMLVVEARSHAEARGAKQIYGEVAGYAATHDGYHHSDEEPSGRQFARAMALAIERAGVRPKDIDAIFADAAGTPTGDAAEARALQSVFGSDCSRVPPVAAPKSMTGRLYSASGTLDAATALLAMRDGILPPTVGLDRPAASCQELDVVREAGGRACSLGTVLIAARGFGGFNSAIVLRHTPPS